MIVSYTYTYLDPQEHFSSVWNCINCQHDDSYPTDWGFHIWKVVNFFIFYCAFDHCNNVKKEKFIILPLGEIVVGEVASGKLVINEIVVGEIGCWGNWLLGKLAVVEIGCWGNWLLGKLLLGKL